MSPLWMLAVQSATSVLGSALLLALLHTPLTRTLQGLCPSAEAAGFWWAYVCAMLTGAPLALVLVANLWAASASPANQLRWAALASLCGLLWGLALLGRRIGAFVRVPSPSRGPAPAQEGA